MHDAFLKSVFSNRRMVEILIRDHVREWAGELGSPIRLSGPLPWQGPVERTGPRTARALGK